MKILLKFGPLLVLLILCITENAASGYDIRIGVLANSGPEKCQKMWTPTAKYLSENLPEYTFKSLQTPCGLATGYVPLFLTPCALGTGFFTIVPLSFDKISTAVRNEEVDFVLANPFIYIDLDAKYSVSRLATLKTKLANGYPMFGGVIFTRADNRQVYKLRDLAGKKFVAVAPDSLGGWLAALRELKRGGIDPDKDFAGLQFIGNHESAIYAVLEGKADAGTASTNEFVELIHRGKIKEGDFRVIVPEGIGISQGFPYPVSTRLYPDWPFAKLRRTPEDLATQVAIALLRMDFNDETALAANCYGWSYPLNYQSVEELSKELRLGTYRDFGEISFRDMLYKYKKAFIPALFVFLILLIASFILTHLYRQAKRAEEALKTSEERLNMALKAAGQAIYDSNLRTGEAIVSPEYALMLGYEPAEFQETTSKWINRLHPDDKKQVAAVYSAYCKGEISEYKVEFRQKTKDGGWKWIQSLAKITEHDLAGKPIRMIGTHTDITERKQAEDKIRHMATHDALTNLPSLRLVKDRIFMALEMAKRNNTLIAIMYIDLDGFKEVNDNFGHESGDILLKEVGKRLVSLVRKSDTVARIGGDEFLMIITELQSSDVVTVIARKIIQSVSEPFDLNGRHSTVGASIGIALYPDDGDSVDILIKQADKAMYAIKHSGKNGYTFVNSAE